MDWIQEKETDDKSVFYIWTLERSWPIAIATGWGIGVAYSDAQVKNKHNM